MINRESTAYADGVQRAFGLLRTWEGSIKSSAFADTAYPNPDDFINLLASLSGDMKSGAMHVIAQYVIVCLDGTVPILDRWNALDELRNPDTWFEEKPL